jgi:serine/threonine protein phosphatase PrpC
MADGGGAFCSREEQPAYAARPGGWTVATATDVGGRPRQEDKFCVQQAIALADVELGFFGVWDGTVCPHASEYVRTRCCDHHLRTPGLAKYLALVQRGEQRPAELAPALAQCCREGYAATDGDLLDSCRQLQNHYSSSTSVTCIATSGILTVAHLGDSCAYLIVKAAPGAGMPSGVNLTRGHKPDDPEERARIIASGGSIEYLTHHHHKPFIRGGDFERRKAAGERVMQLQYSRAFGGKDLKPFGLSAEPTISQFSITDQHIGLVIVSDGISDVANADQAAAMVAAAWDRGVDPAQELIQYAVVERRRQGMGDDNQTAIVCRFDATGTAGEPQLEPAV